MKKILLLFSLLQTALPMFHDDVDDDDWRNTNFIKKNERKNGNEKFYIRRT